jgi:hypothetical protein
VTGQRPAVDFQTVETVARQARSIFGQLSILGVAIVVTLVELAIWLAI